MSLVQILQVGIGVLIILGIAILTLYTASRPSDIDKTKKSQDRLTTLQEVFRFRFGIWWPYTLFLISLLIIALVISLHYNTANSNFTINISDKYAHIYANLGIAFFILFTVAMVMFGVNAYIAQESPDIPNYIANKNRKQIVLIVGLSTFIFFFLILGIHAWWVSKKIGNTLNIPNPKSNQ
jgi:hypothetical protein